MIILFFTSQVNSCSVRNCDDLLLDLISSNLSSIPLLTTESLPFVSLDPYHPELSPPRTIDVNSIPDEF